MACREGAGLWRGRGRRESQVRQTTREALCLLLPANDGDEIADDEKVDEGHDDLQRRHLKEDLVDFQRQERAGDDHDEPFRPALAQEETGALGAEEYGVKERDGAEAGQLEIRVGHPAHLVDERAGVMVVGVDVQVIEQPLEPIRHVLVEEMKHADAGREEEDRLHQFEKSDQNII